MEKAANYRPTKLLLYFCHSPPTICCGHRRPIFMRCPKCGNLEDKVIDSRSAKSGAAIRRRRECMACQHRFTTYEEIERRDLRVVKRDGRHEPFDRQKLLGGMSRPARNGRSTTTLWRGPRKRLFMDWNK